MQARNENPIALHQLPEDQWAVVTEVRAPDTLNDQSLVLRLLELGFVPGERVRVVRRSRSAREPIAVRLGHTAFALRTHEAGFILVTLIA